MPPRWAHQAVAHAQQDLGEGDGWVVDLDFEKCFARGHQDQLMSVVKKRVADRRVLPRIDRDRKAGALTDESLEATGEGPPPGGAVSPVLANRLQDGLDKEVARRGHRFGRDADACNLSVKSVRPGPRGRARATRVLDAMGSATVPATASPRREPEPGLEPGHVGPWAVAQQPQPGAGHRPPWARLRRPGRAAPPSWVPSLTAATEPPAT